MKFDCSIANNASHITGVLQIPGRSRKNCSTSNTGNLITPHRAPLCSSDHQLTLRTLNARSLKNKSAVFVDLVRDVKADLFTICESRLKVHHSAVLSELTPPGYNTLVHCPRSARGGGGTALFYKDGINVNNAFF